MEIRGERECKHCGTQWSYYETGDVACPECGSVRSVGVDDRAQHTDAGGDLNLDEALVAASDDDLRGAAERAKSATREYLRNRGFVHAGDLLDLDDSYLAARELRHAAAAVERGLTLSEAEELYFLTLLEQAATGVRLDTGEVPESMRAARGLAYANAVDAYLDDVRTWLDGHSEAADASSGDGETIAGRVDPGRVLERLRSHVKRVQALDGGIPPTDAETLVAAANDLAAGVRGSDQEALAQARERLNKLE